MVIKKTLMATLSCAMLFVGVPGILSGHQGTSDRVHSGQEAQQQATKSVTGKVTDIGDQGHSFTVETDGSKQTMKFIVDQKTQVQGHVKVGTMVAVDYQSTKEGQLVCVRVAEQNA